MPININKGNIMFLKTIKLDVIATYNPCSDFDQEHFTLRFLTEETLSSEEKLLDYIFKQLESKKDLVKLSLCWICNEETVKKYKTIKNSIKKNAKYYFNGYEKDTLDKTIELIKELRGNNVN